MELSLLSDNWMTLSLAVICCASFALWWLGEKNRRKPPGPKGLPILGNIIPFSKTARSGKLAEFIGNLHKKYGKIVGLKCGVQRFIYINDGEMIRDLYQQEQFSFRPHDSLPVMKRLSHGTPRGVVFANGEAHKEMRRFVLLTFRDLGVGKKSLDEMVQTEASILCQHLESVTSTKGGVISDLKKKMQYATANIIHHVVFGHRYDYDDPEWLRLIQLLYDMFAINPLAFPQNFLPFLDRFPALANYITGNMMNQFLNNNDLLEKYVDRQISEHRESYVDGSVRDFIDLYIKYESQQEQYYTKENLFASMLDLFRAGSDSAATTLTWAVMHLVQHPDIQKQLQDEIDEVVGDQTFDRKQKDKLVKTRAFINELHRYASIAVTTVPHTIVRPAEVGGYTLLPADLIVASLFSIHHDEGYWKNPYTFSIDRWIDEEGNLIKHEGHFYPFSVGKRICPGRQFATIEVMLILVQFLQNFSFEKLDDHQELTDDSLAGILRTPQNFPLKVVKRQ
ncbi:cytochrome P450 2C16-like [Watersipora subatra]|uniref:cytochrome P450 2C16-like n=1 Tax=Watersipora subatra TaxID=2589382 RepID=UPI00355B13C2